MRGSCSITFKLLLLTSTANMHRINLKSMIKVRLFVKMGDKEQSYGEKRKIIWKCIICMQFLAFELLVFLLI